MDHWSGATAGQHQQQDIEALEQQLRELYAQGQTHWVGVTLAAPDFVRYLAERTPAGPEPRSSLSAIESQDLYLCCACVHRCDSALAIFDKLILSRVAGFIAKIDSSPAFVDDVTQILRMRLLSAAEGKTAEIAKYSGAGKLVNWVRVAAVRTALGLRRNRDDRPNPSVDERTLQAMPLGGNLEMENIRARCQLEFKAALTEAFASLTPEQRNILRLHFAGERTGEQIAALLSIGRATLIRRLARARAQLLRETQRLLRLRLRLSPPELDSFIKAALSQIDLSLSALLREQPEDGDQQP